MKKMVVLLLTAVLTNVFTACNAPPERNGVYYIRSQSYVSGEKYFLCFENASEKTLEFGIFGIFEDNNRAVGLDSGGKLKKTEIAPYTTINIDFYFDTSSQTAPEDVIIIGEYE